jgi:hypothetical protein
MRRRVPVLVALRLVLLLDLLLLVLLLPNRPLLLACVSFR